MKRDSFLCGGCGRFSNSCVFIFKSVLIVFEKRALPRKVRRTMAEMCTLYTFFYRIRLLVVSLSHTHLGDRTGKISDAQGKFGLVGLVVTFIFVLFTLLPPSGVRVSFR